MRKIPFAGIELTSQRVRGLRGTSELPGRPKKKKNEVGTYVIHPHRYVFVLAANVPTYGKRLHNFSSPFTGWMLRRLRCVHFFFTHQYVFEFIGWGGKSNSFFVLFGGGGGGGLDEQPATRTRASQHTGCKLGKGNERHLPRKTNPVLFYASTGTLCINFEYSLVVFVFPMVKNIVRTPL